MSDFDNALSSLLRNGVLFGFVASLVSIVIYRRTLSGAISVPTVIGTYMFFNRFLVGIGIGVGIFALIILGARYAMFQYAQHLANLSRR